MAQIWKIERQIEIKSPADKFYDAYRTKLQQLPKMCNQIIKDVKLVQGEWGSIDAVREWSFVCGGQSGTLKETMENTDDKNKTLSLRVVESEILNSYTRWKTTLNVTPKGKGSLVKWTGEYEKRDESVPEPTMYADFYIIMTNILDAYLLDA